MTRTPVINEAVNIEGIGKFKISYVKYEPTIPSENYLIVAHGMGERAVKVIGGKEVNVTDGSLLGLVDKIGYTKAAKNGFEFPFNIIAVQCGVSYSVMKRFLLPWAQGKFGNNIIVTGYSLGGIFCYDLLVATGAECIKFIAPVCGKGSLKTVESAVDLPGQAWHGSLDTTVKYGADVNYIKAYNSSHENQIDLVTLTGVAHNAWDRAYSVETGKDQLLQKIIEQFNAII